MNKKHIIIFGIALIALCLAILTVKQLNADPFQTNIQKLIDRKSIRAIRTAQTKLLAMGPPIVPRLLTELEVITNTLTESEIYSFSTGNPVQHNAKPVLARQNIYNIISALDAGTCERIIIESSKSNSPELCVILSSVDSESLLALPNAHLLNISNSLQNVLQSPGAADGVKNCVTNFFDELRLRERLNSVK